MAKRELITREEAIKTVSRWIKADMALGSSLFEMMMNEIPPITEQEIVKPYLDKITTDIQRLRGCTCSCSDGIIDDVEDIIDGYRK